MTVIPRRPCATIRGMARAIIPSDGVPRRVAIICDGNRRWARAQGCDLAAAYAAATDTVRARVRDALELGIEQLTVFALSTENWSRSPAQLDALLAAIAASLDAGLPEMLALGVRVRFIGRRHGLPQPLLEAVRAHETATATNTEMDLYIALNYGGRAEILDAAARYQGEGEEAFRACLYAPGLADPDLIVRTGGEQRLSNYLLWHAAYSELVFRGELWPEFDARALHECIREFATRSRRFGTSEALAPEATAVPLAPLPAPAPA